MNAIDKVLKVGKDNQYEDLAHLAKVKLNKTLDVHFKEGFIILTAKDKTAIKELLSDIIVSEHKYIPLFASFMEEGREIYEASIIVARNKDEKVDNLIELGKRLCSKFEQLLFLFKMPGDLFICCKFMSKTGGVVSVGLARNLYEVADLYFTTINKSGKNETERSFTNIFVKAGARTINEHHSRTMKGEIQIIEYGSAGNAADAGANENR